MPTKPYVVPRTQAERRKRAQHGRLEVQVAFEGLPLIVSAADLILVAEELLASLDGSVATLDDHGVLRVRGANRTVSYRLGDYDERSGTWVGVRIGGRADR